MNDIVIKLGELLVRAGIVTGVDLSEAEKLAKHMNLQFGQVLIMSGCLSDHDLDCALVAQQLIREELLTVDVACQALAVASQHQMPFEDALEALSAAPDDGAAAVEMAELLADAAIIPGDVLEDALMTSLRAEVPLGQLLVNQNAIAYSLVPVLEMLLADLGAGAVQAEYAVNEIRKHHIAWQRSQDSLNNVAVSQAPLMRSPEPAPAPVFVSQELMHAYEIYEPQQQQQSQNSPPHQPPPQQQPPYQPTQPSYAEAPQEASAPHSIHDVLSMFQQRNPVSENSQQAVPREQQAASWTAFVQSQSFDPNDVEPSAPPMSVAAEEPRLRSDEPGRSLEVVQGTYSKTFAGKPAELLTDTFEPFVPPDFEPAAEVIDAPPKNDESEGWGAPTDLQKDSQDDEDDEDEQFSLLVELLIESTYFDREDIIVAITNALKEESKAIKLIEMLGLADSKAIMAASICADALRKFELTSGEAVTVLGDIKAGAEIHEALESVNLELAVTVSANMQMMYEDEVDETFYVGDVSRTVDIFEADDFVEDGKNEAKDKNIIEVVPPSVVSASDESPPIAFGYGRERLKIAKRPEPEPEKTAPEPIVASAPEAISAQAPEPAVSPKELRPQITIGGKKVSSLSEVFEKLSGVEGSGTPQVKPGPVVRPGIPPLVKPALPSGSFAKSPPPPAVSPVEAAASITSSVKTAAAPPQIAAEEPLTDEDKKAARKRNSTTFNSLQAVFVPAAETLVPTEAEDTKIEESAVVPAPDSGIDLASDAEKFANVSNEASSEYAAYKASDELSSPELSEELPAPQLDLIEDEVSDSESKTVEDEVPAKESEEIDDDALAKASEKSEQGKKALSDSKDEVSSDEESADSSRKKTRSPKAKVRGGAKAAAPKKTKRRK